MADSGKTKVTVNCCDCGTPYQITLKTYKANCKHDPSHQYRCSKCLSKAISDKRSEGQRKRWANSDKETKIKHGELLHNNLIKWKDKLSEEELKALNAKAADGIHNMNTEQKELKRKRQSIGMKKNWATKSQSYKDNKMNHLHDKAKDWWNSLSEDEKSDRLNHLHDKSSEWRNTLSNDEIKARMQYVVDKQMEWRNNMTAEEKSEFDKKCGEWYRNLSDEEKLKRNKDHSDWFKNLSAEQRNELSNLRKEIWKNKPIEEKMLFAEKLRDNWNNLSDNEKEKRKSILADAGRLYYSNLSEEERKKNRESKKEWWDNLSIDERKSHIKNALSKSFGRNSLNDKFEKAWHASMITNEYQLISEYPTSNNEIIHCWDYAAFDSDNKLIAVIDLDGMYPKEEYDEKRPLSIPDGVKMFIITEYDFFRCFKYMCTHISDNYDKYIDSLFNACRTQPFPMYKYTDYELIKSYNTLCKMNCNDKYHQNISLNTRIGDRLIQHFHESIWMDKCKGELSPYEAWNDDEMLRKCIENRIIFQNNLNPYKVLQGFNISKIAPKVSVFSAGRAKMLINKYLSEYDEIFDPFSGYSGRMLGAISLNKTYIGQDISIIHVNESNALIKFLHDKGMKFNASIINKDILKSTGKCQCLFTCPPYADKEQWQDVPVSLRSCDDWIDECLQRFDCSKYVFVVDSTKKYADNIVDVIDNKSHFNNNGEYIVVVNKGGNSAV